MTAAASVLSPPFPARNVTDRSLPIETSGHMDGAFDALFAAALAKTSSVLIGYARRLTGSMVDAEDLLQDTMLRCWRSRASFQMGTNFAAWARAVMRNGFLSNCRRARLFTDLPDQTFDRLLAVSGGQEQAVELRDLDWALGELSPDHRAAVLLASNGASVEEAAECLQIAEGTYKSRVARARRRLRELTEEHHVPRAPVPIMEQDSAVKSRHRRSWKGVVIG